MKVAPIHIVDKQATPIIIREATLADTRDIVLCIRSYLSNKKIPLTLEEFDPIADVYEEKVKDLIDTTNNNLLLVAEYEGRIIGNVDVTTHRLRMLKHTGYIGMGLHPDWQNRGIGTALLKYLIEWADKNPAVEILWLQVFGTNQGAIAIYKKLGFEITGIQKQFLKNEDGQYIDNVIMTRRSK